MEIKKSIGIGDLYSMVISLLPLLENSILLLYFTHDIMNFKMNGSTKYFQTCNFPDDFLERIEKINKQLEIELKSK